MSVSTPTELVSRGRSLTDRGRTWLAYGLAILVPGAGHAATGYWRRGLAWAGLCVTTLAVLSTAPVLAERTLAEPLLLTLFRAGGFGDVAVPLAVLVCSVVDLYGLAVLEDASSHPG
ncbi:hypothetical protein C491_17734 [Natronococcus amylolyticus DSM 10524]|uniref:Uncharacterized protein n=1 Tax=Natronococcus amylolyticus DSM 10524 TaxID=1227497 RepID=L9WZZ3_9EURY|nr:hypothetical protein [Natronococcus amylolyticus]ELY54962.1 hypothetical protein C491_17734 [Natronococcus amylolyticus DSM 10524]